MDQNIKEDGHFGILKFKIKVNTRITIITKLLQEKEAFF